MRRWSGPRDGFPLRAGILFLPVLVALIFLCGVYGLEQTFKKKGQENYHPVTDSQEEETLVFSHDSGFYDKDFDLSIKAPKGMKIYYTLDSTTPTTESREYTEPIHIADPSSQENVYSMNKDLAPYLNYPIFKGQKEVYPGYYLRYRLPEGQVDKCAVVRAMAVDEDGNCSQVISHSYFVGYQDKESYDNLPILSIVTDPEGLFGDEKGIMVNGATYKKKIKNKEYKKYASLFDVRDDTNAYGGLGRKWERKIHVDYFSKGGAEKIFSQDLGIRLHGNQTRINTFYKSFNLYARKQYDGNNRIQYPFFGDGVLADSVTLMRGASVRNYYLANRMNDRGISSQKYRMVQLFIDGEYWGLYAIQERVNSHQYMETHYGVGKDEYMLTNGSNGVMKVRNGDEEIINRTLNDLILYVRENDLSDPAVYHELESMMDIQSFVDCYAAKIYLADMDWRWNKNVYLTYFDHKWHWILYDLDYSAGNTTNGITGCQPEANSFLEKRLNGDTLGDDPFFNYLKKNDSFRRMFITIFMDLANEVYRPDIVSKDMSDFKEDYWEATLKSSGRYPRVDGSVSYSRQVHANYITNSCDKVIRFCNNRPDYAPGYARSYLGLSGSLQTITLENSHPERGSVKINTITPTLNKKGKWSGEYFSDYPVTVTAEAKEGYIFTGWKCEKGRVKDLNEFTAEVTFDEDVKIQPCFEKSEKLEN